MQLLCISLYNISDFNFSHVFCWHNHISYHQIPHRHSHQHHEALQYHYGIFWIPIQHQYNHHHHDHSNHHLHHQFLKDHHETFLHQILHHCYHYHDHKNHQHHQVLQHYHKNFWHKISHHYYHHAFIIAVIIAFIFEYQHMETSFLCSGNLFGYRTIHSFYLSIHRWEDWILKTFSFVS